MPHVTIIGKNSFLAGHLAGTDAGKDWTFLDHTQALSETDWTKDTDVIVNCAFHPDLKSQGYSPVKDIDFLLAGYALHSNAHYIMLSSRAVYGDAPDDLMLNEDIPPKPANIYGQNKLVSEQALAELFPPERLTILRNGNIFGSEYGRSTFFGLMLTSLIDKGVLQFNIAPTAVRDFLSAKKWAQDIVKIAGAPKSGIYNLGSGHGITTQDLAEMLIKHHGGGEIEYTDHLYNGQFILDMAKTRNTFDLDDYTRDDLKTDIKLALTGIPAKAGIH